jgi:hypothetical protein
MAIPPAEDADLTASVLEIMELANGEFVLRRAGDAGEPLVKIRFSDESRRFLADGRLEVARVMFQAGIQAAAALAGGEAELEFIGGQGSASRIVH